MTTPTEREALIARLRVGYTLHQNDTPDLDAADELMGLVADMLEADAQWDALRDPAVLHANLLRGLPAQLTKAQLLHLLGTDAPDAQQVAVPQGRAIELADLLDATADRMQSGNVASGPFCSAADLREGANLLRSVTQEDGCQHQFAYLAKLGGHVCLLCGRQPEDLKGAQQVAVPQSKINVTEEMHQAAVKVLQRANGLDGLPQRMVDAMLKAAPQPPQPEPRKPLTVEEVQIALGLERLPGPSVMGDVRKIEAALGIKEQS